MTKFIALTSCAGEKALINVDKIITISEVCNNNVSSLLIVADSYQTCKRFKESLEEIKEMLGIEDD